MYKCIVCGREYPNNYDIHKPCSCGSKILVQTNYRKINDEKVSFDERIENITVDSRGIFEINISAIAKNEIIIIKDESDIYYVKVPWEAEFEKNI
ncbi:hypothetical protein KO465_06680 [Candidatus Micrarchaeota archaeon]|jgi:predicted  nucleic acid-binding Zn-ribbon protein|nr:hypothetical protein [Candidatus Micrarchaeota archaeon]